MSKFCCITDLIRFMMKEAENLMKGSVHRDDFFIVHDNLVLMTEKDGTPYAGRPVGYSPSVCL